MSFAAFVFTNIGICFASLLTRKIIILKIAVVSVSNGLILSAYESKLDFLVKGANFFGL